MKNVITLLSLTLLTSSLAAHASIRENGGLSVPAAAKIEFFSPGNGIDTDLKRAVSALIKSYSDAGLVEAYTEKSTGMEGERTICVLLNDLAASRELNQKLSQLVAAGERKTNLSFVSSCKN